MYFINESLESLQEAVSESTYNDIMDIVEEIISEVSVSKWVQAAKKVAPERANTAQSTRNSAEYIKKNISDDISDYQKGNTKKKRPSLEKDIDYEAYNRAQNNKASLDKEVKRANNKAEHANKVAQLNVPNSKISATKLLKAASSSHASRFNKHTENLRQSDKSKTETSQSRLQRVNDLRSADPIQKKRQQKINVAKETARQIEDKMSSKPVEKKKEPIYNYGVEDALNDQLKRTAPLTKKAQEEHNNAQINQGLRNKLDNTYKKS